MSRLSKNHLEGLLVKVVRPTFTMSPTNEEIVVAKHSFKVTTPCKNPEDIFANEHPLQAITEVMPPAVNQNQELCASRNSKATIHQAYWPWFFKGRS